MAQVTPVSSKSSLFMRDSGSCIFSFLDFNDFLVNPRKWLSSSSVLLWKPALLQAKA